MDKDRDDHSLGRDRNLDFSQNTDQRTHPAADVFEKYPVRRGDGNLGDKC